MRTLMIPSVLTGGCLLASLALAAEPEKVWQVEGLDGPEAAVLDQDAGVIYVSNVNGDPAAAAGNGYISRLSPTGEVIEQQWVTGLDAPKGMALHDGKLYVSDITKLRVIDVAGGEVSASYDAAGSKFLNDVTVHDDGRVFVSDMMRDQIWKLEGDQFELWLEDPALENPNGLVAEADRLVVASWGVMTEGFSTKVPGHLKVVDYQTKEVQSLGGQPVGNLDGIKPDGKGGYLVTDWMNGGLYRFTSDGNAEMIMDLNQGSADHEYIEDENLVVIPMMMDGTVAAYKIQ